jgi:glycerophosphoryl diester phosphodiesterase
MKDGSFLKNSIFAHRGIYDNTRIYENTISAYTRALKYNMPIEMEVHMLACGTIVVFNDDNTKRLLHVDGLIEKLTYDELTYISKYQIPTLEEVLKTINGSVPILIELRTVTRKYILENKICEILDNYKGLFALESFHMRTIKWFSKYKKNYLIGYMIDHMNFKKDVWYKKYDFLNIDINCYGDKKVRVLKENKIVLGYNISKKSEYDASINLYDGLIVDNLLEITSR